ncbi:hypothetical protein BC829DRAFT_390820 [Chytridium lagenaria]|nr:hypothetical protein BC829DRAFT_390820 [Chytridium lagenaria]
MNHYTIKDDSPSAFPSDPSELDFDIDTLLSFPPSPCLSASSSTFTDADHQSCLTSSPSPSPPASIAAAKPDEGDDLLAWLNLNNTSTAALSQSNPSPSFNQLIDPFFNLHAFNNAPTTIIPPPIPLSIFSALGSLLSIPSPAPLPPFQMPYMSSPCKPSCNEVLAYGVPYAPIPTTFLPPPTIIVPSSPIVPSSSASPALHCTKPPLNRPRGKTSGVSKRQTYQPSFNPIC